jgi:hypothetical protein
VTAGCSSSRRRLASIVIAPTSTVFIRAANDLLWVAPANPIIEIPIGESFDDGASCSILSFVVAAGPGPGEVPQPHSWWRLLKRHPVRASSPGAGCSCGTGPVRTTAAGIDIDASHRFEPAERES